MTRREGSPVLGHEAVRAEGSRPESWIYFLHGIFGRGRNWRSVAGDLCDRRPCLGGLLVDLRLHGSSTGHAPPHTLETCAKDLESLASETEAGSPDYLLGHSFGGKVALAHAERRSSVGDGPGDAGASPRELWIIDSTPSAREPGGQARRMLTALRELPGPFASREEVVSALRELGFAAFVARWMAANLERVEEGYRWTVDAEALDELLADFYRRDLWSLVEEARSGPRIRFVKAEGSDVLREPECDRIEAARRKGLPVSLHRVEGDHWLNASNPEGLLELMLEWTSC